MAADCNARALVLSFIVFFEANAACIVVIIIFFLFFCAIEAGLDHLDEIIVRISNDTLFLFNFRLQSFDKLVSFFDLLRDALLIFAQQLSLLHNLSMIVSDVLKIFAQNTHSIVKLLRLGYFSK